MIIKQRQQLTHVKLKDGRVLTSEASPTEIYDFLASNPHIMIDWEMHSKYSIIEAYFVNMDKLESFILSQPKEIQQKLRTKQAWLKKNMPDEMTLKYAQNYVQNISS